MPRSSHQACSATCAGVKPAAEGAAPRAVPFAPPTRGAAEGVFRCFRETAGIFSAVRPSRVERAFGCRTGVGRLGLGGSSAAVPRPGAGVFSVADRPGSASREPVRARTAPSSVDTPAPARFTNRPVRMRKQGRVSTSPRDRARGRRGVVSRVRGRTPRGTYPGSALSRGEAKKVVPPRVPVGARESGARADRRQSNGPNDTFMGIFSLDPSISSSSDFGRLSSLPRRSFPEFRVRVDPD